MGISIVSAMGVCLGVQVKAEGPNNSGIHMCSTSILICNMWFMYVLFYWII